MPSYTHKMQWIFNVKFIKTLIVSGFFLCVYDILAYTLPRLALGANSFLDGGPIRLQPGVYWQQYAQYYNAHRFLDNEGKLLGGVPSPKAHAWSMATQFIYQTNEDLLFEGKLGFTLSIPMVIVSHVQRNNIGISTSGAGFGDFLFGVYIQWLPVMYHGRPILVHRIEFDVSFPTGKNKEPGLGGNPGNNFLFIYPYWAGTLYFTPEWTFSWRIHYLWCTRNDATRIKAGDAITSHFSLAYKIGKLFIGLSGYYLQQIKDSQLEGVDIPNSRERVVAIGPGALYAESKDLFFFANLYFEADARNRPQGTRLFFRLVKHF